MNGYWGRAAASLADGFARLLGSTTFQMFCMAVVIHILTGVGLLELLVGVGFFAGKEGARYVGEGLGKKNGSHQVTDRSASSF